MKLEINKGATSQLLEVFISDSSKTDGSGLTGVAFGDITGYYYRSGAASPVQLAALKTMTVGTWVTEGFKEIDATNMPGYYQLGVPNAALLTGVDKVNIMLKGATNMAPLPLEIQLIDSYVMYDGGIWVDSGAANTNTVPGVDGLPNKKVSTLTAARTIADAIGVKKYYITNSSALTLAATHESWEFVGLDRASILNLGSQDLDNSVFTNLSLAGTQGGTGFIRLVKCTLTSLLALRPWAHECGIAGNITILTGTMLTFDQCYSCMPGDTTFTLTFTAGVTSVNWRHGSGGLEVKGMTSDHTISYEADGQLIVNANCVSGNVTARGNMSITDNGTTMNITKDAVYNTQQISDSMKLSPAAGVPASGSVNKHLDDILDDTGTSGVVVAVASKTGYSLANAAIDAILTRAISNAEGSAASRCLLWAIAKLTNKVSISGGTLSVKKTNDTDNQFTQAVTSDANADPITEVNTD